MLLDKDLTCWDKSRGLASCEKAISGCYMFLRCFFWKLFGMIYNLHGQFNIEEKEKIYLLTLPIAHN